MIRYLQLPFHFDAARMQDEVNAVSRLWQLHFNQHDYTGHWSGIPLRSPGGDAANLYADTFSAGIRFKDTPLLEECPYIRTVIDTFLCDKLSVRLLKLGQGAVIKEHTDVGLNFEQGEVRIHVPVVTHPLVDFFLDGDRLEMLAGDCWYINAGLPHRLANPSPVDRIHLIIDCEVNDWITGQFGRDDLAVKSVKDMTDINRKEQLAIIAELRASGDPVRIQLAETMEQGLL